MPVGTAAGQSGSIASSSKQALSGFSLVDISGVSHSTARREYFTASNYSLAKAFVADMTANWNMAEYRKALKKACKALPISSGSSVSQREPEQGPCTVRILSCESTTFLPFFVCPLSVTLLDMFSLLQLHKVF